MTDTRDLEKKFWKALDKDRTVMLGASDVEPRPMTAMAEEQHAPLWFFTSIDTELAQSLEGSGAGHAATASFASKDHDLFATITGQVMIDNDRAVIERLWNPVVAAWYEDGKDDPKLALLRFDLQKAEIWLDASSIVAGAMVALGISDPKESYKDNVATVRL